MKPYKPYKPPYDDDQTFFAEGEIPTYSDCPGIVDPKVSKAIQPKTSNEDVVLELRKLTTALELLCDKLERRDKRNKNLFPCPTCQSLPRGPACPYECSEC